MDWCPVQHCSITCQLAVGVPVQIQQSEFALTKSCFEIDGNIEIIDNQRKINFKRQ